MASVVEQAEEDTEDKIGLEAALLLLLLRLNKKILRQFTQTFGNTGAVIDVTQLFGQELRDILLTHSHSVSEVFSNRIGPTLPTEVAKTPEEQALILQALALFIVTRSEEQAAIILGTMQDELDRAATQSGIDALAEATQGNVLSQQEIAVIAAALVARATNGRAETIACTETQAVAEAAKATEANVLAGQPPPTVIPVTQESAITKQWVTKRDTRVRRSPFNHVAADRQKVDMNDVFVVSGEQLRWPGDRSLGASSGNVIRCRCSCIVNREDLLANRLTRQQQTF